jgi:hypothetical protein
MRLGQTSVKLRLAARNPEQTKKPNQGESHPRLKRAEPGDLKERLGLAATLTTAYS